MIIEETIRGDALFDTGRWDFSPRAEEALSDVAAKIRAKDPNATLSIVGHTDSRGTVEENQRLSERRAAAVAAWFVSTGGFAENEVGYRGAGETELLAPDIDASGNFDEERGANNRRVEIFGQVRLVKSP